MFMDANATHIALTIEGISTDLQVLEFTGRETLNKPYRIDIELVSESPDLDSRPRSISPATSPSALPASVCMTAHL
ncbi:VgrG protein [Pseudomonas chlororaphis subsp. piscium]|uniref:hypothetical protein n=1 Tax=Pseudomonas chlororaphis TaxID=587753 RepID=UPI000F58E24D|nr:hypothetical protein [Pseudomonas chlororaphis]AZC73737.1 VgrG protein [Pseudomonas chlororaphis subsp. piscium]